MTRHLLIAFALTLSGCHMLAPVAATTTCYEGRSDVTLPDGRSFPAGPMLVRRVVDPAHQQIVEEVISEDHRTGRAREFRVTLTVRGQRFTMVELSGAFSGEGELTGPAWQWTAWRSVATLPRGGRVESTDLLSGDVLVVDKTVYDASGAVVVRTAERLHRIDAADYDQMRAKRLGEGT